LIASRRDSRSPPTSIARSQSRWRLASGRRGSAVLVFAASRLFRSLWRSALEASLEEKLALRWAWRCGRGEQGRGLGVVVGANKAVGSRPPLAYESVAEHAIRPVQACFGNHQ